MCCGRTKDQEPNPRDRQTIASRPQLSPAGTAGVPTQYIGATAMTVIGPVSGKVYRFDAPGARIDLDRRDATRLAAISKLKFIR